MKKQEDKPWDEIVLLWKKVIVRALKDATWNLVDEEDGFIYVDENWVPPSTNTLNPHEVRTAREWLLSKPGDKKYVTTKMQDGGKPIAAYSVDLHEEFLEVCYMAQECPEKLQKEAARLIAETDRVLLSIGYTTQHDLGL